MLFQHRHWVEAFFTHKITRIHDVEDNREDYASTVDAESDPPEKLLVKPLLEVLENNQADCETSDSSSNVSYERHWGHVGERLAFVARVDGKADVAGSCEEEKKLMKIE